MRKRKGKKPRRASMALPRRRDERQKPVPIVSAKLLVSSVSAIQTSCLACSEEALT